MIIKDQKKTLQKKSHLKDCMIRCARLFIANLHLKPYRYALHHGAQAMNV